MSKIKKSAYPKSIETYKKDPVFYEELAILKAQEKIAELMKNSNTTRTALAQSLKQSKAHVTELLSNGRNLTLRTFARVCFHLNAEIDFQAHIIGTKKYITQYLYNDFNEFHNLIADRANNPDNMIKNNTLSSSDIVHNKKIEHSYQIYKQCLPGFNKNITDPYKAA